MSTLTRQFRGGQTRCLRDGSTAEQPHVLDRPRAGARGFAALHDEVIQEETLVLLVLVETLGRQHGGDHGYLGVELDPHQRGDHGIRHELVAIDATIDDEARRHDRHVPARLGQQLRLQWDLEGAGHVEEVDTVLRDAEPLQLRRETLAASVDDVLMPARLHEGDPSAAVARLGLFGVNGLSIALIHGSLLHIRTRIRAYGPRPARRQPPREAELIPLSFIRTVTVGVGIAPTLLTPPDRSAGRSRAQAIARHHRRWGLPPRPENVRRRNARPGDLASIDRRGMLGKADPSAARTVRDGDYLMDLQLKGRAALVTGASMGIGRAVARMLAAEGAKVAVVARRKPLLEELAAEIARAQDPAAALIVQDVMAPDAAQRIRDQAMAALGKVEILVNSAGGSRPLPIDAGDDRWDEAMTLNFTRVRQLTQAILPGMMERKWGRIVNITGKSEPEHINAAFSAKAGLHAWAKGLSRDVGRDGITINSIAPGRIMSEQIRRNYPPEERERFSRAEIPVDGGLRRYQF